MKLPFHIGFANLFVRTKYPMISLGTFKFIGIKSQAHVLTFYDLNIILHGFEEAPQFAKS